MKAIFTRRATWLALLAFTGLAGFAWFERKPILSWHYVRLLTYAYEENREERALNVAALEQAALPGVLEALRQNDLLVCANMQHALFLLANQWGLTDPRTLEMFEQCREQFDEFSPAGREKVVYLLTNLLRQDTPKPLPPRLTKVISDILVAAEQRDELLGLALLLAAELIDCVQPGQWVDASRAMVERGIADSNPDTRTYAAMLLIREPMRKEKSLYDKAKLLLRDPHAGVRQAVMVILASATEEIREESFMHLLHDEVPGTRELCETILRKRGLTDNDIEMARKTGDEDPITRMQVLEDLRQMPGANLHEWLRRLSHDPEAAVRAAAVRAAGDYLQVDFSARLREMAAEDPNETVRQNARYYLWERARRSARE